MFRSLARVLCVVAFIHSSAGAQEAAKSSLAPVYDGPHVVDVLRFPQMPRDFNWSDRFMLDTNAVLTRHGWYLAEVVLLVDESGQVRDTIIVESVPALNLSATIVNELRRKTFFPGDVAGAPVPASFSFLIKYTVRQYHKSLNTIANRLRRQARNGDASAQYLLSRAMQGAVGFNKEGLDADELLRAAADPGGDRRAMLALGISKARYPEGQDPATVTAERRAWQLKAAEAGSGAAQVLTALDSWAEQTPAGHARARHWLEKAVKVKNANGPKYLAALLVSHSDDPADWKTARELATAASTDWHDRADPDTWQILAAACARMGDFPKALEAQQKALDLATESGWKTEVFARRLASYQASQAVKEEIVVIPTIGRVLVPQEPPPK